MPTTVKEIYHCIDTIAPFERAMDFDNCGILAGDATHRFKRRLSLWTLQRTLLKKLYRKKRSLLSATILSFFSPCVRFHSTAL